MQHPLRSVLSLALTTPLLAQDPLAARVDPAALQAHYAAVERELRAATPPADAALAARRARAIDLLAEYRRRADFGQNPQYAGDRVPLFVDGDGRRCAVAWLLDGTGHGDLTLDIARRHNRAWVAELLDEPALAAWLGANGLSAFEAARIQGPGGRVPTPQPDPVPPPPPPRWNPDEARNDRPLYAPQTSSMRGSATAAGNAAVAAGRPTAAARGTPIVELGETTWTSWWNWNRAHLELLPPVREDDTGSVAAAQATARADAEQLLASLARSTLGSLRTAAVQALGRVGAAPALLAASCDDPTREVQLAALLGLRGAASAAQLHALVTRLAATDDPERRSIALTALTLTHTGALGRTAGAVVEDSFAKAEAYDVLVAAAFTGSAQPTARLREQGLLLLRGREMPLVRAAAAELFGAEASRDEIAALTAAVGDRSVDVRRSAGLALGRSRDDLALPALQTAFELEHEELTRAMLLLAIGDHGGAAAGDFLQQELTSGSKSLRAFAALALGLFGRQQDRAGLAVAVEKAFAADGNRDQQGAYLIALGMLREGRGLLRRELRSGATSLLRGAAAAGLGLHRDATMTADLGKALREDSCPWVREQAANALANCGGAGVPALEQAMRTDAVPSVRASAAWALGGTGDERAGASLLLVAADEGASVEARVGAVLGLGRHFRRGEPSLPRLRFQHNYTLLPGVLAWGLRQEL